MDFVHGCRPRLAQAGTAGQAQQAGQTGLLRIRLILLTALALFASFPLAAGAKAAQKNQKEKQQDSQAASIVSSVAQPDSQAIDTLISQMLGAWQVGDVDLMHKFYADDVTVVSGEWEQPLFGWASYVHAYQLQRKRTQGDRLDRSNSYTKVTGQTAWCTYQWRYTGLVDGVPAEAFGHTTLVLEKRSGTWLIVLNHTSVVPVSVGSSSTSTPQAAPPNEQHSAGPGN